MENQGHKAIRMVLDFCKAHKRLLISIAIVLVVGYVAVMWLNSSKPKTLLAGMTVNVPLSDAGTAILTTEFQSSAGLGSNGEEIYLGQMELDASGSSTKDHYGLQSLDGLCANEQLDYLVLDQVAFEMLLSRGIFRDLTELYTQSELEAMGDMLVYCRIGKDAPAAPMALNITSCPYVQKFAGGTETVYFVFVQDSPRADTCREFLSYLLAWDH